MMLVLARFGYATGFVATCEIVVLVAEWGMLSQGFPCAAAGHCLRHECRRLRDGTRIERKENHACRGEKSSDGKFLQVFA